MPATASLSPSSPAARPAANTSAGQPSRALQEALVLADAAGDVRAAAQALRTRYAPARVVVVDAFDMRGEAPAAVGEKVSLYFAASDGHCWQVTTDPARAAGLFIAAKE